LDIILKHLRAFEAIKWLTDACDDLIIYILAKLDPITSKEISLPDKEGFKIFNQLSF